MKDINPLQDAVRNLHGCESAWIRSEVVHETFQGETVWAGQVEVFELHDHAGADIAYAWSYITDEKTGERRFIAVLGVPPINSAVDAVRASIAAEGQG